MLEKPPALTLLRLFDPVQGLKHPPCFDSVQVCEFGCLFKGTPQTLWVSFWFSGTATEQGHPQKRHAHVFASAPLVCHHADRVKHVIRGQLENLV